MKVIALVILAFSSASALGSGPYLPSGWRPDGPAFYLPSETQKLAENPVKDLILQESEASGSDALREYGPPQLAQVTLEVSQDLVQQGLPDEVIEQVFGTVAVSEEQNADDADVKADIKVEPAVVEESVTESQIAQEQTTLTAVVPILVLEEGNEETLFTVEYDVTQSTDAPIINILPQDAESSANELQSVNAEFQNYQIVQDAVESIPINPINVVTVEEEQVVNEIAQNIPEVLANLENEVAVQLDSKQQQDDISLVQNVSGSLVQAPEGFLEYGPPGFQEYGPPKGLNELANVEEKSTVVPAFELTNETRRRRFSPKFRPAKISTKH